MAAMAVFATGARCQDSPPLGDVARQARQQKQQKDAQGKDTQGKDATGKNAKPSRVITNEEIPERSLPTSTVTEETADDDSPHSGTATPASTNAAKISPDTWKSQILAQKNQIASMQTQFDELSDSIHFAPGNCVANCVEWNERQKEKQQEAQQMQTQLDAQRKHLEEMQEAARKQGYGSSVYDP
jgi:leucyl aminopeptidase (aminopeptidase T)